MKEIAQILFLLAVIAVFSLVGGAALRQPAGEWTVPRIELSENFRAIESTGGIEVQENKTEGEEVSLGKQEENKEWVEGLSETDWHWVENQKKLYELTPTEVNSVLKELPELFPNKTERLKILSILRLGTPYLLGCLGEESGRDEDPIFRLDVTDCTTFVLTNVALLYSQTIEEAKAMMQYLNYWPDSETTFENRLHFTIDRNEVSPYFKDITGEVLRSCSLKAVEVTLNKIKADGERLIDIDWEKEVIFRYIPSQYITKSFLQRLPEAIGIAFIKEGDEAIGLDVRHEGFLFAGETLFHASSIQGKIVAEDFFEYYFGEDNDPRFDGIVLYEVGI